MPYCFTDSAIEAIKKEALRKCQALNAIDILNTEERTAAIKDLFGTTGENASVCPNFNCDNGKNIHVGEQFLMNYNGIILDVAEVRISHHVMIGPNTMITTVNHPLTRKADVITLVSRSQLRLETMSGLAAMSQFFQG